MTVLIIDDDPGLLRSLELLLTSRKFHICPCSSIGSALACLNSHTEPDILLLDYFIGEATGSDFLRNYRSLLPGHCRVLLMTGHREQVDADEMRRLGVARIMKKPVDLDELCQALLTTPSCN